MDESIKHCIFLKGDHPVRMISYEMISISVDLYIIHLIVYNRWYRPTES